MEKNWTNLRIAMLLTGSELIDGRLQDSNSLFVARFLFERGQRLFRIMVCDDNHEDILDSLKILASRSDVIITSGGLGPTSGDKTREAIASFLGMPLSLHQPSLEKLKRFFAERNRAYESNNDKQAYIPEGSLILENEHGTASCFAAAFKKENQLDGLICALPGVPRELEKIIPEKVIPAIVAHFSLGSLNAVSPLLYTIRTFGLGESSIAARVEESKPDSELIDVSYRATFPEVQVLFRGEINKASESQVEATALNAISQIGTDFVFSRGKGNSLPEVIHNMLLDSEKTLSLAESCSGGMLGCLLTDMAGSSRYFLGSYVTYSNDLKCSMLGISKELIEEYGAVSAEVAVAMAKAAREKSSSDISVSITGIAGPQGGSEQKPVGTCFLALSDKQGAISARIFFSGSRKRIRQYACHAALDLIRRRILGFPIDKPVFLDVSEL